MIKDTARPFGATEFLHKRNDTNMEQTEKLQQARTVYEAMCLAYEKDGLKFDRHDEDLTITFGMSGDDLPMEFVVVVIPDAQLVRVYSRLPVTAEEDRRVEAAMAVVYVNSKILNGSFDLRLENGTISFNVFSAFHGSVPTPELFRYLLGVAYTTIDRYNDRFLMLAKGMIDLQKFMQLCDEDQ